MVADDANPASSEGGLAPHVPGGRAHALEDAVGGEHRGVAGTTSLGRATGRPPGGLVADRRVEAPPLELALGRFGVLAELEE